MKFLCACVNRNSQNSSEVLNDFSLKPHVPIQGSCLKLFVLASQLSQSPQRDPQELQVESSFKGSPSHSSHTVWDIQKLTTCIDLPQSLSEQLIHKVHVLHFTSLFTHLVQSNFRLGMYPALHSCFSAVVSKSKYKCLRVACLWGVLLW